MLIAAMPVLLQTQTAEDKYKEASAAFDRGEFEQAIGLYEEALKLQPESVPIRTDLGVALVRLGRYSEAIDNYEQALKRDPGNVVVRLDLTLAWYKQENFAKAAELLEALRKDHPENRQTLYLLADCYLRLGREAELWRCCNRNMTRIQRILRWTMAGTGFCGRERLAREEW